MKIEAGDHENVLFHAIHIIDLFGKKIYHIGCFVHKCSSQSFCILHSYSLTTSTVKKIIKLSNADALIHLMQNVSNTVNKLLFQLWLS